MIDISIVVPVLNEVDRVGICLDHLRRQSLAAQRYEIIVVDNGSTDGSLELLQAQPDIQLIQTHHRDPYLARNAGAQAARGSMVVFTDAHCIADSNWLARHWEICTQTGADCAAGPIGYTKQASYCLNLYGQYHQVKMAYLYEHDLGQSMFCHAGNLSVRKDVFEQMGGFRPLPVAGDTDFLQRLRQQHPHTIVRFLPAAVVRRQSVRTVLGQMTKSARHAKLNQPLRAQGAFATLSWKHRREVFRKCVHDCHMSRLDAMALLCTLMAGVVVYNSADLSMRMMNT